MNNLSLLLQGYIDSFKVFKEVKLLISNNLIIRNLKNCLLFNGILLIGTIAFYSNILLPAIDNLYINELNQRKYIKYFILAVMLKVIFYSFFLIPVFLACNILSSFWIDEIYLEVLKKKENTSNIKVKGQSFLNLIINQVERMFIVLSFVLQNHLFSLLKIFDYYLLDILYKSLLFISLSILHSIYVFEYILLQKYIKDYVLILSFVETRFMYFLGFGINFTVVVFVCVNSFLYSTAVFLIIFPFYLIGSIEISKKRFVNTNSNKNNVIINKNADVYFLAIIAFIYKRIFIKSLYVIYNFFYRNPDVIKIEDNNTVLCKKHNNSNIVIKDNLGNIKKSNVTNISNLDFIEEKNLNNSNKYTIASKNKFLDETSIKN